MGGEPRWADLHLQASERRQVPGRHAVRLPGGEDLVPATPGCGCRSLVHARAGRVDANPRRDHLRHAPQAPGSAVPALHGLQLGPQDHQPKALTDNAGKDHAQTWANDHAIGTGPFQLTAFERGQRYELTRFDGYWGQKAHVDKVEIRIIPDIGTQRLQLQSGDLDAILHTFPQAELESVKTNPDLQVQDFSSYLNNIIYLNTNKEPLSDPALRKALASAINRDSLVTEVYGTYAKPSSSTYPSGLLDPALAPVAYPPSETTAAVGGGKKLTFAYTADDSGVHRRIAELVQQRLDGAGFSVTINEVQLPQVFEYVNDLQAAPDMVMQTNTPDGAHPDMWARIEWYSTGGLNYLGYKSPQADKLLDSIRPWSPPTRPRPTVCMVKRARSSPRTPPSSSSPIHATSWCCART